MPEQTSTVVTYKNRWAPLELKEVPVPELAPNQVLIRTEYAGLNPIDIKLKVFALFFAFPVLLEGSGVIEKVGSDLTGRFKVGERVTAKIDPQAKYGFGSHMIAIPDKDVVVPTPERLKGPEAGGFLLTFGTAYQLLSRAKLTPESEVLVLGGATMVGAFAIQIAKLHYKVKRVVATASPRSFDYVKDLGADEVVDYKSANLSEALIRSASPTKYQTIVDCVGGYDALAVSDKLLRPVSEGSNYATVFGDTGPQASYAATMGWAALSLPRTVFRILFGKYYGLKYDYVMVSNEGNWGQFATEFFKNPATKVPVDSVYPLADVKKAWDRLDSTQARGKVMVEF